MKIKGQRIRDESVQILSHIDMTITILAAMTHFHTATMPVDDQAFRIFDSSSGIARLMCNSCSCLAVIASCQRNAGPEASVFSADGLHAVSRRILV
jgi:hypothetical protein